MFKDDIEIGNTMEKQRPLRVVVLHGDPNKPNDILPGGKYDEGIRYIETR